METNVYLLINIKNNSFYAGITKIQDLNYLGAGIWINDSYTYQFSKTALQQAVKTDGLKNFKKIILYTSSNEQDSLFIYSKLINKESFAFKHVYNNCIINNLDIKDIFFYDVNGGKIIKNPNIDNFTKFEILDAAFSGNCLNDGKNMYYCSTYKDVSFDRARKFQIQTRPVYQYDFRTGQLKMFYDTQTIAEKLNKYSNITKAIKLKVPDKNGNMWSIEECDIFNSKR